MMPIEIDGRGLACPGPVLKTKEAVEKGDLTKITVLVDNDAAVENVSRFLTFQGFDVSVDSTPESSIVTGRREETGTTASRSDASTGKEPENSDSQKIMVMIGSEAIGRGDDELGRKLMLSYIKTLKEMGRDIWRLVFVNGGVRFAIEDSELLGDLKAFEESGIHILVCGTCLNHFDILDKKRVGETTNMLDIVTAMQLADKIINL